MAKPTLPREIAKNVHWLGECTELIWTRSAGEQATTFRPGHGASTVISEVSHVHVSAFLIIGADKSLLVDTGQPSPTQTIFHDLDELLRGRPLDYICPTHPELPHCGNLPWLLARYKDAQVVGDVRDYHLYYPQFASRLATFHSGDELDLGGGNRFVFVKAIIPDLPSTQWGYEARERILFVADAFAFLHGLAPLPGVPDEATHKPGDCALFASELTTAPTSELASMISSRSLYWTHFVDIGPQMEELDHLMTVYPTRIIAPAHANVITNVEEILPMIRRAHDAIYVGG